MQKPWISAITGLGDSSIARCAALTACSYACTPSSLERFVSNSEMSAPAANATVPSPRTTTQRTAGSASKSAMALGIARHISPPIALRRAGLSSTIRPIGPSRSTRSLPSPMQAPQITLAVRSSATCASV